MLRRSTLRRMVPFHPFVTGGRPAERGMLYRDSQQNAYTRVQSVAPQQRTEEEWRMHSFIALPEFYMYQYWIVFLSLIVVCRWLYMLTLERSTHKNRHLMGGFNYEEVWKRNTEMAQIFEFHREMIDSTLKEFGPRPEIFDPPTKGSINWNNELGKSDSSQARH
jgi:hypothetical protein